MRVSCIWYGRKSVYTKGTFTWIFYGDGDLVATKTALRWTVHGPTCGKVTADQILSYTVKDDDAYEEDIWKIAGSLDEKIDLRYHFAEEEMFKIVVLLLATALDNV